MAETIKWKFNQYWNEQEAGPTWTGWSVGLSNWESQRQRTGLLMLVRIFRRTSRKLVF